MTQSEAHSVVDYDDDDGGGESYLFIGALKVLQAHSRGVDDWRGRLYDLILYKPFVMGCFQFFLPPVLWFYWVTHPRNNK